MVHDTHGIHHFHKRKRKKRLTNIKKLLDKVIYIVVFTVPLLTIPQVWNIWVHKNAAGVSIISWATYMISAIFWLFYAIVHKEKPLIISSAIWIVLDALVVLGTFMYS